MGAPPWSSAERTRLVARVRTALYDRARRLGTLPPAQLGGLKAFLGYGGAELLEHLERRHAQGCLVCGNSLGGGRFEICHIDPLAIAHDAISLSGLMQLHNIGLAHVRCNRRLGKRPLR